MSQTDLFAYAVTAGTDGDYTPTGNQLGGLTTVETVSTGDEFVFDGKVFTVLGAVDLVVGNQVTADVGFMAVDSRGKEYVFSTSTQAPPSGAQYQLNASESYWICFLAGTQIATPKGPVAVESLAIGDPVLTAEGKVAPVRWIGRQTVSARFCRPEQSLPIRIRAGALAPDLPQRDLCVSPAHAILVDGVLVQAGALVNDSSIVRERDLRDTFVYYHVELDQHELVLAEGVPAETFIDHVERIAFDNWAEHEALYPQGHAIAEMPHPRAASARQVPAAILRRLAERARAVFGVKRDAA